MIRLEDVKKVYRAGEIKTEALRGVSVSINNGEMVAITGPSGSGKSTLLNIIGCMDELTEGSYLYDDIKVDRLKASKLHKFRKNHVSFIFQHFALINNYTIYENVEIPLLSQNIKKKERKRIVMEKLEEMRISELEKKLPTQISGGQQQRCAIARALASGNNIILADEPTGALDKNTSREIMDVFESINQLGKTIIIITHDENVANRCQRVIRIEDGKIV